MALMINGGTRLGELSDAFDTRRRSPLPGRFIHDTSTTDPFSMDFTED